MSKQINYSIIMTPTTYKQQLIFKLSSLLSKQRDNLFTFDKVIKCPYGKGENDVYHSIQLSNNALVLTIKPETGKKYAIGISDLYIEDLWDLYMACESIYDLSMRDYANIEG